jgi:hypothetical protein
MKRKKILSTMFVLIYLFVSFGINSEEPKKTPVAVSPGSITEVVSIWQSCPTFSWSAVDQASSYRIVVFEAVDPEVITYEDISLTASPLIDKDIPGPALSWTLPAAERLKIGIMYSWYVQAIDVDGNPLGNWSNGNIFKVEQEVFFAGIEEKLAEKMREYGVNEETISNVLKDVKSEVKEVMIRNARSEESIQSTPHINDGKGTEGVNTYYGVGAGFSNTSGTGATFIGVNAGYSNTTGIDNTFLGRSAGYNNTIGGNNTFTGQGAGYHNTSGNYNTFLGYYAGFQNTNTSDNTFVGEAAGYNNIGSGNIFIGRGAGYYNTGGGSNIFIGNSAGSSNTSGSSNTFLGYLAGYNNTTVSGNVFIGDRAGYTNTTGANNTFIGKSAGYFTSTKSNNTFLGYSAGFGNTTGERNSFIGSNSGYANTSGVDNAFIGYYSGYYNSTGNFNTFIGGFSGIWNTIGFCNTFVGNQAGNVNDTGNSNTYIGNNTGFSNTTGSGNVFLGSNAGFSETGSNKLYIANSNANFPLIYGEFDNGIVSINGQLGVGTKTPLGTFEIEKTGANAVFIFERTDGAQGKFTARPNEIFIGSGSNHNVEVVANNNRIMTLTPGGYVGIGTSTPSYPLHMSSGAYCSTGGTWTNASSRRLKENIHDLTIGEAVEALLKLNPVKYNYKTDKADMQVGFIAEDVPDLVATADRKGMSPMDVVAVLTKVVQEQHKIITDLQERMAKIEKEK